MKPSYAARSMYKEQNAHDENPASGRTFVHPQMAYFGVGRIGRDQLADYAWRKGMDVAEVKRWLAPNLE